MTKKCLFGRFIWSIYALLLLISKCHSTCALCPETWARFFPKNIISVQMVVKLPRRNLFVVLVSATQTYLIFHRMSNCSCSTSDKKPTNQGVVNNVVLRTRNKLRPNTGGELNIATQTGCFITLRGGFKKWKKYRHSPLFLSKYCYFSKIIQNHSWIDKTRFALSLGVILNSF